MRRSLRRRLFQAIGLIVALSVAITLGLGLVLTRRAVQEATLQDVAHQAALIAGEERNSIFPGAHLPQLSQYLAEQHELYRRNAALLPPAAQDKLAPRQAASGSVTIAGIGYYFAAEPLTTGPPLILLRPRSLTKSSWSPFVESILIAALVGGVLAAAAAYLLARRIVRPVGRVAAAARSLARGTHPEPVPVEGSAELATLALAFNDLSEQLARAREAERSFLLSVSHELKTPLTAIRGWAEALREGAVTARGRRGDDRRRGRPARAARRRPARSRPAEPHRLRDHELGHRPRRGRRRHRSPLRAARGGVRRLARRPSPRDPRRRSPTPSACSRSSRTSSRTRSG